jgi:hypothetical protein
MNSEAASTPEPASMARRSGILSSRLGNSSAAIMEPPPKAANANAVARWLNPNCACTSTTVLTITIAPAAATARLSANRPLKRGVAR